MERKADYTDLYRDIQRHVEKTLRDLEQIHIISKKGNRHIESLKEKLQIMSRRFSDEIQGLQEHSEWDKFTIAFFGETNAGKSTIIEALRILFSEKKRQERILGNRATQEDYAKSYIAQVDELEKEMIQLQQENHNASISVANEVGDIRRMVAEELEDSLANNRLLRDRISVLDARVCSQEKERVVLQHQVKVFRVVTIVASGISVFLLISWIL